MFRDPQAWAAIRRAVLDDGMRNFLDILIALVRLLYVYHLRGAISWVVLMSRVSRYIFTATDESESRANS